MEIRSLCELAENVIKEVCDEEIFHKYMRIKQKILSTEIDTKLIQIQQENENLKLKIEEIKQTNQIRNIHEYVINELSKLEHQIIPDSILRTPITVQDACLNILDIIETRQESATISCKRLEQENNRIKARFEEMDLILEKELERYHQHNIDSHRAHEQYKIDCARRIEEIQYQYEDTEKQITATLDENKEIVKSIHNKEKLVEEKEIIKNQIMEKATEVENKVSEIRRKAEIYRTQYELRERQINSIRNERHLSLKGAKPNEVKALTTLESQIAELVIEHEKLSLELKRCKLSPTNESSFIDSSFSSFINF